MIQKVFMEIGSYDINKHAGVNWNCKYENQNLEPATPPVARETECYDVEGVCSILSCRTERHSFRAYSSIPGHCANLYKR